MYPLQWLISYDHPVCVFYFCYWGGDVIAYPPLLGAGSTWIHFSRSCWGCHSGALATSRRDLVWLRRVRSTCYNSTVLRWAPPTSWLLFSPVRWPTFSEPVAMAPWTTDVVLPERGRALLCSNALHICWTIPFKFVNSSSMFLWWIAFCVGWDFKFCAMREHTECDESTSASAHRVLPYHLSSLSSLKMSVCTGRSIVILRCSFLGFDSRATNAVSNIKSTSYSILLKKMVSCWKRWFLNR